MATTTQNESVVEFRLDRVDAEELLYGTIGYEIETVAQSDEWIVLIGESSEMRRFAETVWAGLARSKGWWPARPLIVRGVVCDWNE